MAIDAVDLDGSARLAVNFSVAVIVLCKVAIIALHPFFEMDIGEVDGFAETVGILEGDLLSVLVQPVPFAVVIKHGAKNPAMAVKIGELRGLQLLAKFGTADVFQKLFIAPEATHRGALRIAFERSVALLLRRVTLLLRVHLVAIDFVVPPGEAEIGGDHVRAGMDVADHALARRYGAREGVFDGMVGSEEALKPEWPNFAYAPECAWSRSLA